MAQALSNLPIGAKVKFGKYSVNGEAAQPIIWLVVAKNHSSTPAYPSNAITILTEKIVDMRAFDAIETNRPNGYNRYSMSNIDQWLNSDDPGGGWFVAKHSSDAAPIAGRVWNNTAYGERPGFLNAFSKVEKNSILTTTICSRVDSSCEDIGRKVFIPSTVEVGAYERKTPKEGSKWSYLDRKSTRLNSSHPE